MGVFDFLKRGAKEQESSLKPGDEFEIGGTPVKVVEIGSSGTENFAGYLSEEYLQDLRGKHAADVFDKMRRSDPKIKMILSAMKNPIKSATWEVVEKGDTTREGEIQKAFIEHVLFHDLGKTWKQFLHEALSMIDFGYSVFEITYKAQLNHEVFGSYNGVRSIAFRSQRTIERWNVNKHEELMSISQYAFGDGQKVINIPSKYLLHFAIDKEGNNFEGISILRPCYGPWLRKNTFLKLIAAGVEKYAIPIPILKIPEGKQSSEEYKNALNAMKKYVSHQCNYLTVPHGWDIELKNNPFDASKIRDVIDRENVEMVNAALANFLELGQSGSGSYALSFDLSDFFLGGLEYVAEQIAETINNQLIPKLIELNFPNQKQLVELKVSGISDRAGEELSKIVSTLVQSGVFTADDRLEDSLRKRFGLPDREESTEREAPSQPGEPDDPVQLAEKKPQKKKSSDPVERSIDVAADKIKAVMKDNLMSLKDQMISQAVKHFETANKNQRIAPPKKYNLKGVKKYTDEMLEEFAAAYNNAVSRAKTENPRLRNIKLSETESRILLAEKDKLNTKARVRIRGILATLIAANIADVEKSVNLQYSQSSESTDSPNQIKQDLNEQADKTINGPMTTAGAIINASTMVNSGRKDFFDIARETGEIDTFTWVNPSPVSEICKGLNGTTMEANSPDVDRYWPPLHHNCKTYVVANSARKTEKENLDVQSSFTPTKSQAASITLAEGVNLTPPDSARNNAKKVKRWIEEHGRDEVKGMTQTGLARMNQLIDGGELSPETVKRIAAFNRHRKNATVSPEFKDTPWKDRGHVAWLGWGGTTGVDWAIRKSAELDRVKGRS